ncbi:MAG: radical SAM protein [Prevotellaceae bacterium]|jgi:radical SAM protein with 4Fe4S-binding SPASM domain|nr:radical SAM protein [Prevotellaceae bacterium]
MNNNKIYKIKIRKEKELGYIAFNARNRQYHYFETKKQPTATEIFNILGLDEKKLNGNTEIFFYENTLPKNPNIKLSAPLIAYLEINNSCVLNCKHCFKSHIKYSHKINTEKILSLIDDLEKMGVFELRFVGFEAIYNSDFVRIVQYAKNKRFYLILNTCGYFMPEKIKLITDLNFDEVLISLDGDREAHDNIRTAGSYDKVINLLKYLSAHNVKTRINMTVSNNSINKMQHIAEIAVKHSVNVGYTPMRHIGNGNNTSDVLTSKEMYQIASEVNKLRKQYPEGNFMLAYHDFAGDITPLHHPVWQDDVCPATKNVSILNDGRVFFCDFLEYIGDKYCGGNILEDNINDIWQFSESLQYYRDLKKVSRCYSCKHYKTLKCSGGCASEILDEYDIFYDRLCFVNPAKLQCEHELSINKYCDIYNERYYMNGKSYNISNYENYSWMPQKTNAEVSELIKELGINDDVIVDYGCAFGYYVKAFRDLNYKAYGIDTSEYAIRKAKEDKTIADFVIQSESLHSLGLETVNWVIAKDVLEHLTVNQLIIFLKNVKSYNAKLFVAVPLTKFDGGKYICGKQVDDIGHIIRRTAEWWISILKQYLKTNVARICLQNFHLKHTNKDEGMGYFVCNSN